MAYDTRYHKKAKTAKGDVSVFNTGGYIDPKLLSSKEKMLSTMFKPPTEIMTHQPFDEVSNLISSWL